MPHGLFSLSPRLSAATVSDLDLDSTSAMIQTRSSGFWLFDFGGSLLGNASLDWNWHGTRCANSYGITMMKEVERPRK